jgi:PPM family protein phosphatase
MKNNYEIYTHSIHNKKDSMPHNGDYLTYNIIDDEELVLLILADGVGSTNYHWEASWIACQETMNHFIEFKEIYNHSERLKKSIFQSNQDILTDGLGDRKGMLSTIVCVLWDRKNNKIYYTNAGDSRLYKINQESKLIQLTNDQSAYVQVTKDGKPYFQNGAIVYQKGITNSMGLYQPKIEIDETDFLEGESLVLLTDGFYECQNINENLEDMISNPDLESSFDSICKETESLNDDDASIIVLRRNDFDLSGNLNNQILPEHLKSELFVQTLCNLISINKSDELISFINNNLEMTISRNNLIKIFKAFADSALNQNTEVYQKIIKIQVQKCVLYLSDEGDLEL